MPRRPIGIEAAPTRAFVESIGTELQQRFPDQVNEILLRTFRAAMEVFENPEESPEYQAGKQYKSPADAYKLRLLFRRLIEKLITSSPFEPDALVLEAMEMRHDEVEFLRRRTSPAPVPVPQITEVPEAPAPVVPGFVVVRRPSEDDEFDINLEDYQDVKTYGWEDLRSIFTPDPRDPLQTGVARMTLQGYGDCLILGYTFNETTGLRKPIALTLPDAESGLEYDDTIFNLLDSVFKTVRHQSEKTGQVFLIKAIPYRVNSKGRSWINKKGERDKPDSKRFFITTEAGVVWVSKETYYAFDVLKPNGKK
jgi:hypothetical protein